MAMNRATVHRILTYGIAAVWIAMGLFCKVLNLVPRHQQIVARILDAGYAPLLTKAIGVAEIAMALWIISGIRPRLSAITQIVIVGTMNVLEFILAPDLLLWGKLNAVYAAMFMTVVGCNEFLLRRKADPG